MRVLLLYPWYPYSAVSTFEEPLGVLYLASVLKRTSHRVNVVDLTFAGGADGIQEEIRWAEVVGISAPTPLFGTATELLGQVRAVNPNAHTIVGGPHPTANPTDALRAGFDVAVIGESEVTLPELVDVLANNGSLESVAGIAYHNDVHIEFTEPRSFIENVDDIPLPSREYIDYSRYRRLGIISMRGCPYRCLFCKPIEDKLFGRKLRRRSVEGVVEEILGLLERYGNRPISFKDDTLTVNPTEWFEQFGNLLAQHGRRAQWQCSSRVDTVDRRKLTAMKKVGCRQIFFGIESGSQRILDYYCKDITVEQTRETFALCHEVGIRPCASVMIGAPHETRDDLDKTLELIKSIRPFNWHVHVTTPICGTYLYERTTEEGRLPVETDYFQSAPTGNLYQLHLPMALDSLSLEDIAEYRDRINRYMKVRLLLKCLFDWRLWKEVFVSRGLRAIALNFIWRHFRPSSKTRAQQPAMQSSSRRQR